MRLTLPPRRRNVTQKVVFRQRDFTLTIGYDAAGRAKEVFAGGHLEGSDMQATIADACVVISVALQHGVAADALAKSLGTVPVWGPKGDTEAPASVIGAILKALIEVEVLSEAVA